MVLATLASSHAFSTAPASIRTAHSKSLVARRPSAHPFALLGAGAARRHGASFLATSDAAPIKPLLLQASFALKLLASLLCSSLCFAARAYAAERLKTAPVSSVASAPFVVTADMMKWGGLAVLFGAAYAFRREEVPILTETVVEDTSSATSSEDTVDAAGEVDVMSALRKRMQELAEERKKAEESDPNDSSGEWGTGSTAVLEPPPPDAPEVRSSLLDDGPAVDFPVGFPLREGEIVESAAAEPEEPSLASKEQIEMLERMFGTRSDNA
ncbi:hypothetical protein AB1Y20_005525 [Prymnesium parvum]|uniref:Uncharacterized protein n=1 Tax=Prymnesium parvum TaxID=97485 RepID=A0AB34J3L4_PRYPA